MSGLNLSAGQTVLSPGCRSALARQMDTPIYYPDYYHAELEVASLLQGLIGTQCEVLLVTGNATHAMEMTLLSLLEPGEAILTVNSGTFGQVFTEIARVVGVNPIEIKIQHGQTISPERLENALRMYPRCKAVSLVHIETSTGVMAPLAELAQVVRKHGKLLIVDAVSSLGVTPLHMDEWGIDTLISSGQKALNAPQGLSILAINQRAWQAIETRQTPIASVCLDIRVWQEYRDFGVKAMLSCWNGTGSLTKAKLKVTHGPSPSAPLVYGLLGALRDIFEEGVEKVFRRHEVASRAVREGLRHLGLPVLAAEEIAAPSVTTVLLPERISELEFRKVVYHNYGIALGAGPVEIGLNAFRIGTMGRTAHPEAVIPGLVAVGNTLPLFGHLCQPDAGRRAAMSVFDRESTPQLWKIANEPNPSQ